MKCSLAPLPTGEPRKQLLSDQRQASTLTCLLREALARLTEDPERNGAGCYLVVQDADEWHARMNAEGLPVTPIEDQPWGMREYTLTDPSGNRIRIGRAAPVARPSSRP